MSAAAAAIAELLVLAPTSTNTDKGTTTTTTQTTQVLTDVSHISLDLASYLGPGAIALRLAAVVGRLCTMVRTVVYYD